MNLCPSRWSLSTAEWRVSVDEVKKLGIFTSKMPSHASFALAIRSIIPRQPLFIRRLNARPRYFGSSRGMAMKSVSSRTTTASCLTASSASRLVTQPNQHFLMASIFRYCASRRALDSRMRPSRWKNLPMRCWTNGSSWVVPGSMRASGLFRPSGLARQPLMASSLVASGFQLPVIGWFTQIGLIAAAMSSFFAVAPEPATACSATLLLVTFLSIIPVGLIWARFEHVSLRKVAVESEHADEELSAADAAK